MRYLFLSALMVFIFSSSPLIAETSLVQNYISQNPEENSEPFYVSVYNHTQNTVSEIDFEEYIVGVVFAEMPVSFGEEALKAQAVACRSYILRRIQNGYGKKAHGDADICTNFAHCTAYYSYEYALECWNESIVKDAYARVRKAVESTKNLILTYNGETADCLFHASSYKYTERAENVWGKSVPYLISVDSPDEVMEDVKRFTAEEFRKIISENASYVNLRNDPSLWINRTQYSSSGRIAYLNICGESIDGTKIRSMFSLKSACFNVKYKDGEFVFTTYGHGHGVGMSQYGAKKMGEEGFSYTDILAHYYPGTELKDLKAN